ncbi:MAG: acyltransferase [Anaerolineales bacterium]
MIPGLDGLRAIAFLLVFACHTDYLLVGWTGVLLFFVLSGFLITGILNKMKARFSGKEFLIRFYGRRFLRIFPLYYLYLFLMIAISALLLEIGYRVNYIHEFYRQVPYAFVYLYNFFYASSTFTPHKFLDHFWSLSVEEQFYIFWPLLIFLTPDRWQKRLFLSVIILTPVFRLATAYALRSGMFPFFTSDVPLGIYPLPWTHIDAFAMGAYISRYEIPRPRLQLALLLILVPVAGFASQYISSGTLTPSGTLMDLTSLGYTFPIANAFKHIWGYSLLNYLFTVLIYCVARQGLFTRALEWKPLTYLGKISYGMYVFHFSMTWFAARIRDIAPMPEDLAKPLTALIAFALTLALASLSYRFVENPILNLKDRYFKV